VLTEEFDHAPPKVMFRDKHRPPGLEVPSCKFCNRQHSPFDDCFALLCMAMGSVASSKQAPRHRIENAIRSCRKRFPSIIEQLSGFGWDVAVDLDGDNTPAVAVPFDTPDIHFVVEYMAARLATAIFYDNTGLCVPVGSMIATKWWTWNQPLDDALLTSLIGALPNYQTLSQGAWEVDDQFATRFAVSTDKPQAAFLFRFHSSFMASAFLFDRAEPKSDHQGGLLFRVTEECIRPVNAEFPADVRIRSRQLEE